MNTDRAYRPLLGLLAATLIGLLCACGGSGSGSAALETSVNPTVAAQIDEIRPAQADESVPVFIELDATEVAAAASVTVAQSRREALQERFLADLKTVATSPASAASTTGSCSGPALQARLAEAKRPTSGAAVRIELTSCELGLLPRIPSVRGVHVDIPLATQAAADTTALHQAIVRSFDGAAAWPSIGGQPLAGANRVIAVLDTGVDERHPALAGSRVLPGACFSTASNGGTSFCPNGTSVDTTSPAAGRSCVDSLSSRSAALSAGCGHGTGMAAVAAMDYSAVVSGRAGVAKSATILPVQVFNADARGSVSANSGDLLAAIEWVIEQARLRRTSGAAPIAALNMSLGGGSYAAACDSDYLGGLFRNAFERLRNEGVVPVVAAGNGGDRTKVSFPACVSNSLQVAAAKLDYSSLASYSNFSSQVKLVAIGGDGDGAYRIPTPCSAQGSIDCWSTAMGTSPATALVSGAVASLHALQSTPNAAAIVSALTTIAPNDTRSIMVQGVAGLRLTAAAERLSGLTATNPVASDTAGGSSGSTNSAGSSAGGGSAAGSPATPPSGADVDDRSATRVCVHYRPNFSGQSTCRVVRVSDGDTPISFPHVGIVRSVSIRDALTEAPAPNRVKVTLIATQLWFFKGAQLVVTQDNRDIDDLTINYLVRKVQIEPLSR